ncbi:MAG TPA: hypothetical protein VNR42_01055 [Solirubrobacteraceae bacterium]|nr:hypothetical protein [Solirubrobacteraceae bacterium]
MSLRDQSYSPALSAGDHAALDLLVQDRDECGAGVSRQDLELAAGTQFPAGVVRRLYACGHLVGLSSAGRYQLSHDEVPVQGRAAA